MQKINKKNFSTYKDLYKFCYNSNPNAHLIGDSTKDRINDYLLTHNLKVNSNGLLIKKND